MISPSIQTWNQRLTWDCYLGREPGRMARASAAYRRLIAIPGVGQLAALAFVAAIHDPSRVRRSRDAERARRERRHPKAPTPRRASRLLMMWTAPPWGHLVPKGGRWSEPAPGDCAQARLGRRQRRRRAGPGRKAASRRRSVILPLTWSSCSRRASGEQMMIALSVCMACVLALTAVSRAILR